MDFVTREYYRDHDVPGDFDLKSVSITKNGLGVAGTRRAIRERQWYRRYLLRCSLKDHKGHRDYWTPEEKISGPQAPKRETLKEYPCPECDPRPSLDCPCCLTPTIPAKTWGRANEEFGGEPDPDEDPEWLWDDSQEEGCPECGCRVGVDVYDDGDFPKVRAKIVRDCEDK